MAFKFEFSANGVADGPRHGAVRHDRADLLAEACRRKIGGFRRYEPPVEPGRARGVHLMLEIEIRADGECGAANPQYSARVFDRNGISYPTVVLHRDLGFPAAASMLPGAMVVGRIYFEVPVAATLIALQWNWYPDRFVTQIDLGL